MPGKTIAQELEDRMWYLADPKVEWARYPGNHQACLIYNPRSYIKCRGLTHNACLWLAEQLQHDKHDPIDQGVWGTVAWNDNVPKTKEEVIWMLEEMVDLARWLGV